MLLEDHLEANLAAQTFLAENGDQVEVWMPGLGEEPDEQTTLLRSLGTGRLIAIRLYRADGA